MSTITASPHPLRTAALHEAFDRDGYVVVDLLPPDVVAGLLDAYEHLDSGIDSGYYPSLMSTDDDYKAKAHRLVTDLVWPHFGEILTGFDPLLGVFMVKHPGPDTEVVPHQDWIVAEGSRRPTMNAWAPLTKVDDRTGQMRVLPGSHHWLEGLRGSPVFPTQWEAVYEQVRDELMVTVPLAVGQAMIYDIRILHGTPPNRSDDTRIVTSVYAIPDDATPVHYYRDVDTGTVTGHRVPNDFCTKFVIGDVPEGEPFTEITDYTVTPLSFDEIAERYRTSPASRG